MNNKKSNKQIFSAFKLLKVMCIVQIMLLAPVASFAQTQVSGVIRDSKGAVPGVAVSVVGTTTGVMSDVNGNYSITVPAGNSVLQFSCIGYLTQEVAVGNRSNINVDLVEFIENLDEVVVVGYGTQKKVNLTGAVDQVTGEVLENRPITNLGQGLQGVIPNLNITTGGAPGVGSSYNIRGETSLNGGSPLILVDNVQMDANLVNPDDIESISVLKDAASAAIYGARAAYGVILITTKSGKNADKPKVSFSATGYWQTPCVEVHNVNSRDFLEMKDIAYQNSGGSGHYYNQLVYDYTEAYMNGTWDSPTFYDPSFDPYKYGYCGNTDWWDEIYRTSFSQIYNASISGGTGNTTYYASLGINDQQGILKATVDKYQKYNANVNIKTAVTKWMTVSAKIMDNYTDELHPSCGNTGISSGWSGLSTTGGWYKPDLNPIMPVKHDDGHYSGQGDTTNVIAVQELGGNSSKQQNDLWLTGGITLTPLKGLVINIDYTWNHYENHSREHVKEYYDYTAVPGTEGLYPWTSPSSINLISSDNNYQSLNAYAEYTKTVASKHNFKVMAGYNFESKHTESFSAGRKQLLNNDTPALNLAAGDIKISGSESQWAVEGIFCRFNYDYAGKYLLEFNGRYDGSSKFQAGHRYAFFPSFSAGWRISEESFFEPLKGWWNNMKFRVSYGSLGNQAVSGNFPYLSTYGVNSAVSYLIDGKKPVSVSAPGLVSPNLTWEKVYQIDAGFDAAFLDNRLTASFDWYRRDTKDMLTNGEVKPTVLGTSVPKENAADMKTYGWEVSLSWKDHFDNGLGYNLRGVLSDYQSEITKFENPTGLLSQNYVGMKRGEIWGYVSNGLYQSDEEAQKIDKSYLWGGHWTAGDVSYEDLNGDGKINQGSNTLNDPGDRKIIGNSNPRFSYGINFGLDYKGFDFSMFWQGIGKRDFVAGGSEFYGFTDEYQTPKEICLDYWTTENRDAYFPRPCWANGGNRTTNTRYLQDASYVRLKNLTLGYTLPKSITDRVKMERVRVYVQGENILTFSKIANIFDPETLNNMSYPINKKLTVGLNVTF